MPKVKVSHFTCPGAGPDAPAEGYEVIDSDEPFVIPGSFLLDTGALVAQGIRVEVEEDSDAINDPYA